MYLPALPFVFLTLAPELCPLLMLLWSLKYWNNIGRGESKVPTVVRCFVCSPGHYFPEWAVCRLFSFEFRLVRLSFPKLVLFLNVLSYRYPVKIKTSMSRGCLLGDLMGKSQVFLAWYKNRFHIENTNMWLPCHNSNTCRICWMSFQKNGDRSGSYERQDRAWAHQPMKL